MDFLLNLKINFFMHEKQLDICALQNKYMVEKLDEISTDVKRLCETSIKQDAINVQVLRAIEDLNRENAEQKEYLDNLKLFAWVGRNWKECIASIIAVAGLWLTLIGIKTK